MFRLLIIIFVVSCVSSQSQRLLEGSPCTWNGVDGQCVSVFRCLSAVKDIEKKVPPPICKFEDKVPIVCCTDCQLVNDTRLYLFEPSLGMLTLSGTNKAKDKCLEYVHRLNYPCKDHRPQIIWDKELDPAQNCTVFKQIYPPAGSLHPPGAVGGMDAERGEFPHMALLGYGTSVDSADWLCGGTVISEKYILTAAHCLSSPSVGPVKYVALGILQRSDPRDTWQIYNVTRDVRHPEYKPPSKYHDIALLETDREISFNAEVRPACLHVDDQVDSIADATGWGALGHRKDLADVLQAVRLRKFSDEECSGFYPPHRHLVNGYDHRTQMCFGDILEPKDTCEGDSGGPLQSQSHEQCVYTVLGVTSYGRQCGISGGSGMYTRVSHYVRWIEDIVWP